MGTADTSGAVSLWEALATVPDHRRAEGKRYPLASLLLIAIAAMLAGRCDQLGIVRWGRRLNPVLQRLPVHPGLFRCLLSAMSFQDQCQGKKPSDLPGLVAFRGQHTKGRRGVF